MQQVEPVFAQGGVLSVDHDIVEERVDRGAQGRQAGQRLGVLPSGSGLIEVVSGDGIGQHEVSVGLTLPVAGDAGASAADGAPALEDVTVEVWRDPG